jgi:phospholipase D1/2
MEANSGVKFEAAQVALARQWLGDHPYASGVDPIKKVSIKEPQPTGEGIFETIGREIKGDTFNLPASEEEARQTIERFERGAYRNDDEVADSVSQHMLNDKTGLLEEKWLGTEEEERNA